MPEPMMPAPDEIFDVVNELDQVVGRESRATVHRLGLLHRAVHVLVFNSAGQIFLQKRSVKKDCFPGLWDSSAAGHLDQGESYDACAVRELREELGLELAAAPERLFKIEARIETGHEFVWVYRCWHNGPFTLDPEEVESGRWIEPVKLDRWIGSIPGDFASSFPLIWSRYRPLNR